MKKIMTQEQFNTIDGLKGYLLRHPDQEMVLNSCLHYLGDEVQKLYSRIVEKNHQHIPTKLEVQLVGNNYKFRKTNEVLESKIRHLTQELIDCRYSQEHHKKRNKELRLEIRNLNQCKEILIEELDYYKNHEI